MRIWLTLSILQLHIRLWRNEGDVTSHPLKEMSARVSGRIANYVSAINVMSFKRVCGLWRRVHIFCTLIRVASACIPGFRVIQGGTPVAW